MTKHQINTEMSIMHLVVKLGMDKGEATQVVRTLQELYRDALLNAGKVVLKGIGTLETKVIPAKNVQMFGQKKKMPTRYKVKFQQSKTFVINKSPLKPNEQEDPILELAAFKFSSE